MLKANKRPSSERETFMLRTTRLEADSIGTLEVPATAYYGVQSLRANELLGGKLGAYDLVYPNDHVNMAQSTNDVIPTTGKITTLDLIKKLLFEYNHLEKALLTKAKKEMYTVNLDGFVNVSGTIKTCAVNLSKMCNDLRLLSSGPKTGLCEISLPAKQNGSSIMPGKVTPVIPEAVNQVAFNIVGNDISN